jgi:hypothetical protein
LINQTASIQICTLEISVSTVNFVNVNLNENRPASITSASLQRGSKQEACCWFCQNKISGSRIIENLCAKEYGNTIGNRESKYSNPVVCRCCISQSRYNRNQHTKSIYVNRRISDNVSGVSINNFLAVANFITTSNHNLSFVNCNQI